MKKLLLLFVAVATIMTVDAKPKRKKQPSKKTTTEHVDDFALLNAAIKKNKETLAKNPHFDGRKKEEQLKVHSMPSTKSASKEKNTKRNQALRIQQQRIQGIITTQREEIVRAIEKYGLHHPITQQVILRIQRSTQKKYKLTTSSNKKNITTDIKNFKSRGSKEKGVFGEYLNKRACLYE